MKIFHDLRLAVRLLKRNPSTTAIALASIALGVGAAAIVFAAVKAMLISPLPYAHADELVQIRTDFGDGPEPSIVDFGFWIDAQGISRRTRTLESVGFYGNTIYNLAGEGSALRSE